MPVLSNKSMAMPASPIRKLVPFAEAAKDRGTTVYHLNIGQPDIETPKIVRDKLNNLDLEVIEYSHSAGFLTYRQGLSKYDNNLGIDLDPEVPWEITAGKRLPLYCNVTIEFAYIGSEIPQDGAKFYDIAKFRGSNVAKGAADGKQPSQFDAVDDLITGLDDGVTSIDPEPYNMFNDVAGDVVGGVVDAGDGLLDFFIPGDQSGDNAASKQISGLASKAYDGVKSGGKKVINFLNPFD